MIGVIKSFDTSAIDTLDFNKIRRDLFPVLNKKDNFQLDERTMDEFISEAMRTDIKYNVTADSIDHLCSVRHILKDEILTCYQFLKEEGLLQEYHDYRG